MQKFHNILYVSSDMADDAEPLKQALSLARNNGVGLKILIVVPEFSGSMQAHKEGYSKYLEERMHAAVLTASSALELGEGQVAVNIQVESGGTPAIRIIRHVLRAGHDLVIKGATPRESGKGFRAVDMELLRKCPCPVWLCRPIKRHRKGIHVAVAINPEGEEQAAHDLSLRLLELSQDLAGNCSGTIDIISCWDYIYEESLRNNPWIKIKPKELQEIVEQARLEHLAGLKSLLKESGICSPSHLHHMRGDPAVVIPEYVRSKKVDILVMGTVARTGIPSFTIGNTAEDILQTLTCSLLALKPPGFVSPVKAY